MLKVIETSGIGDNLLSDKREDFIFRNVVKIRKTFRRRVQAVVSTPKEVVIEAEWAEKANARGEKK